MFIVLTGTCYYLATSILRFIVNNYTPQLAKCSPQQVAIERIVGACSAVNYQGPKDNFETKTKQRQSMAGVAGRRGGL